MRIVEILQYSLKPGTGQKFHQVMVEISVPLHHEAGIDVVVFGCSLHDEDSYYLIRAFDDIEHMEASQEAFYGSEAWQNGPRTAIIERIKTSVKAVITLPETVVEGLRNQVTTGFY
ncbi:NIPSNAP family protein [Pantoea allii]|uniref:NIPSNAP family protein n=1 Tax=Pantoea allii TaxID=574096 RepID=UPI001561A761|nr:NIPSNAP family protein [Pantoea allii]NQS86323.1 NIPSNAP family protein [Pantoea allii]